MQDDIIKSVRIFEERGIAKIDYYIHSFVKLPKTRSNRRVRFSTSKEATSLAMKYLEKHKISLALEHYHAQFEKLENKDEDAVLFSDIAFLALQEAEADRRKSDGSKDYMSILKKDILPTFGAKKLVEIKPAMIKAWQQSMGKAQTISQSRFNKKYYVLKRVLDYAIENSYIDTNPISYVKRSSKLFKKALKKDDNYFSKEQMRIILDDKCQGCSEVELAKYPFIHTYMYIAFLTGARVGEIASLKWDNINFEKGVITFATSIRKGVLDVTKTDEVREVPMVNELREVLLNYKENSTTSYLFIRPRTHLYYKDTRSIVDTYYKPLLKRLNLPYIVMYQTRATFASISIEKGIALGTVSKCLGHKSTEITSRFYIKYGKVNPNDIRDQLEKLSA